MVESVNQLTRPIFYEPSNSNSSLPPSPHTPFFFLFPPKSTPTPFSFAVPSQLLLSATHPSSSANLIPRMTCWNLSPFQILPLPPTLTFLSSSFPLSSWLLSFHYHYHTLFPALIATPNPSLPTSSQRWGRHVDG